MEPSSNAALISINQGWCCIRHHPFSSQEDPCPGFIAAELLQVQCSARLLSNASTGAMGGIAGNLLIPVCLQEWQFIDATKFPCRADMYETEIFGLFLALV